jgi:hypothetical protein
MGGSTSASRSWPRRNTRSADLHDLLDTVVVPAGSKARYAAPTYARMLAIYGPNPEGLESGDFAFRRLDDVEEQ